MNYKEINNAILRGENVNIPFGEECVFYNYLLNNRVGSYFSRELSSLTNSIESQILQDGNKKNNVYYKTLDLLLKLCSKENIPFLLYKTYKYFGEVIGGDIDIIIKKEDFNRFLDLFSINGWSCIEDEPGKGKCQKEGFMVIEPHVNISWNGNFFFPSELLWEDPLEVEIDGNFYCITNMKFEVLSIYLKILYEPEYLDLYDYKILLLFDNKLDFIFLDKSVEKIINKMRLEIEKIDLNYCFPYFFSDWFIFYANLINFCKTGFLNKRMFIHNIYWRLRYKYNQKLPYLSKYTELKGGE